MPRSHSEAGCAGSRDVMDGTRARAATDATHATAHRHSPRVPTPHDLARAGYT